ncbi:pilin glycosylation ligase domain-containing protein [Ottowia beijingensis]|uniref:pilin glycosylation ligase domain-containing protein n=1 Tax=Ottowia beijingensis TaxID=1207057 RepID=UPI00358DCE24
MAQPGQAFGNLRQPNQLASLLVMGLLALRWWVQAGRVPMGAALALGALLVSALAATASRVGLAGKWGQITISDFIRHMGADLPAIKRSWRSVVLSRASPLVLRCLRLFAKNLPLRRRAAQRPQRLRG